jgi:hypothetical protein
MKTFKQLLICLGLITLGACADDKGNYDYVDINEVSVESPADGTKFTCIAFVDSLNIEPVVESTLGSSQNYEYEWKMIPVGTNTSDINEEETILSHDPKLKMFVTQKAGEYSIYFSITDKDTGIRWINRYAVNVRSLTSEGWLVLCDNQGESRMDVIFNVSEDEDIVAHNIWSESTFKTGKPERLFYNYYVSGCATLLVTDKSTYKLDHSDLHAGEDNDLKWNFGDSPESVHVIASAMSQAYSSNSLWAIINDQKELYVMTRKEAGSVFEYPMNKIGGITEFEPAPFLGVSYDSNYSGGSYNCIPLVLYDATHRQFLQWGGSDTYPSVMKFSGTQLFSAQTGRDMVHMESTRGAGFTGDIYAILKDSNSSRHYFYEIKPKAKSVPAAYWWEDDTYEEYNEQKSYGEIIGEGLDQATKFACHYIYPYVFYVSGHSIYQFDMSHPDEAAQEVLSFPNEDIVVMRFNPFVGYNAYADWERERGYQLLVGTNVKGASQDACGIMRLYEVPAMMEPLVIKKEFTGLGKIVDIAYKEQSKS